MGRNQYLSHPRPPVLMYWSVLEIQGKIISVSLNTGTTLVSSLVKYSSNRCTCHTRNHLCWLEMQGKIISVSLKSGKTLVSSLVTVCLILEYCVTNSILIAWKQSIWKHFLINRFLAPSRLFYCFQSDPVSLVRQKGKSVKKTYLANRIWAVLGL